MGESVINTPTQADKKPDTARVWQKPTTRRNFLAGLGIGALGLAVVACDPVTGKPISPQAEQNAQNAASNTTGQIIEGINTGAVLAKKGVDGASSVVGDVAKKTGDTVQSEVPIVQQKAGEVGSFVADNAPVVKSQVEQTAGVGMRSINTAAEGAAEKARQVKVDVSIAENPANK